MPPVTAKTTDIIDFQGVLIACFIGKEHTFCKLAAERDTHGSIRGEGSETVRRTATTNYFNISHRQ